MKTEANEMAHPGAQCMPGEPFILTGGLTKREHFAALAMQGMLANSYWSELMFKSKFDDKKIYSVISKDAVAHADALIEALNKEGK